MRPVLGWLLYKTKETRAAVKLLPQVLDVSRILAGIDSSGRKHSDPWGRE